jgi:hypothetical protein
METTQIEVNAIAQAVESGKVPECKELMDLELTLVGGGVGDPIFC